MSNAPTTSQTPAVTFGERFAQGLPELAVPWQAEEAPDPRLLVLNEPLATQLGLDPEWLSGPDGLRLLTGHPTEGTATPVAQAYAGHQFGGYSPRLGDGRALLLGELTDDEGGLRDVHLKGSGRTPFARGGDGLAAVGPMLREYVISEAMHALGIPTTRSLAVVATGRPVRRETLLPGAVLARVAASHLRVGTVQYARATGDLDLLRRLVAHALERHHPAASGAENPALALLDAVVTAQAELVARWMLVGFVHGVMNTDNMTLSGETIDYGPCAFMDVYDPSSVYSSIDHGGRYAYGNQPAAAQWNLARLAEALVALIDEDDEARAVERATEVLQEFPSRYRAAWTRGMRRKLGLPDTVPDEEVDALAGDLLGLLEQDHVDLTTAFRGLGAAARGDAEPVRELVLQLEELDAWLGRWRAHDPDGDAMDRVNPLYVPRNHLVEEALEAATAGDVEPLRQLVEVVTDPFTQRPGLERYAEPAPETLGAYRTFCGT